MLVIKGNTFLIVAFINERIQLHFSNHAFADWSVTITLQDNVVVYCSSDSVLRHLREDVEAMRSHLELQALFII